MIARLGLVVVALLLACPCPALAQKLISALSDAQISITSGFSGHSLTLFGNVEPAIGSSDRVVTGPFDVVIVISGPVADRVVRRKERRLGIYVNTEEVTFRSFPTFYRVLASRRLSAIADETTLDENGLTPMSITMGSVPAGTSDARQFSEQLIRLMTEADRMGVAENAVRFLTDTFYTARAELPSDVPNGNFLAKTYVFKQGQIVATHAEAFRVRTIGFERFVGDAAHSYPLLYGLATVMVGLFTGWLGGALFRRA